MDKLLTVRIDEKLLQQFKMATVAQGTTMAEVVREALSVYVSKNPARGGVARPVKAKAVAKAKTKPSKKN